MTTREGQIVVVGGTKGLGRVVAERFASAGHRVTIVSRGTALMPNETQDRVKHVTADLEHLQDGSDLAQLLVKENGLVRYLIFCQRYRGSGDIWAGELQVTLTATKLLVEALQENFETRHDCSVTVVSSVYASFVGGSQPAGYHVAKAGLNQLVRYFAWQLGRRGIRFNSVMPLTYIKDESRDYYSNNLPLMELYEKFVPLRRPGEASDTANLIEFLSSDKASFINGQCIYVDGGVSVVWPEELAKSLSGI